jgi:hypothetical protein
VAVGGLVEGAVMFIRVQEQEQVPEQSRTTIHHELVIKDNCSLLLSLIPG